MQDFDSQESRAKRRPKDGGHAGGGSGDEQNASLAIGRSQDLPDKRAERASHLHRGSLAAPRTTRAER